MSAVFAKGGRGVLKAPMLNISWLITTRLVNRVVLDNRLILYILFLYSVSSHPLGVFGGSDVEDPLSSSRKGLVNRVFHDTLTVI